MAAEDEPDYGFDYKEFLDRRKANPKLRSPREQAYDSSFHQYRRLYDHIGNLNFEVDAPHEMFAEGLECHDGKWVMVDAIRGQMFDDSTRRLKIVTARGRYSILNEQAGARISGIFDSTSPQKFVLEPRPLPGGATPELWLMNNAIRYATGQVAGYMDSVGRIGFEQDNMRYWNGFLGRAVAAHLGSFASERQSIKAA